VWKFVATGALTAIVGFVGHNVLIPPPKIPDNIITEERLQAVIPGMISQYSPYTADQKNIATQLVEINTQIAEMKTQLVQQGMDITNIAAKVRVTASPTVR
jgi:hypothetical protein